MSETLPDRSTAKGTVAGVPAVRPRPVPERGRRPVERPVPPRNVPPFDEASSFGAALSSGGALPSGDPSRAANTPPSKGRRRSGGALDGALDGAHRTLRLCTLGLVVTGAVLYDAGDVRPLSLGVAALGWPLVYALVIGGLHEHRHERFGAANVVTTIRAAIVVALAALVIEAGASGGALAGPGADARWWAITGAALVALALDGLDGPLARATRTESAFGARYDMESDALLALVLALLVWCGGEIGAWVLALGTMRYVFVVAAAVVPALRAPLYPSVRRKAVCVLQIGALCAVVSPAVAPPLSTTIAAVATLALAFSFGRDTRWLLRRASIGP